MIVAAHWMTLRRVAFFSLVIVTTLLAMGLLAIVFQQDGMTPLEALLLLLYTVAFSWICLAFWTLASGFMVYWWGGDPLSITAHRDFMAASPLSSEARTALLIPIYNEDPVRVFAGIRAMIESLALTPQPTLFDIYVLSDTRDPDIWIEEERHWYTLQQGSPIALYYRHRPQNTARKSGNIADFCRRWGSYYRYMVIADADSLISGTTLHHMVQLMELHPQVGLIQVPPMPIHCESLFARVLQFASRLYGPLFIAGLNFWQLSDSNYWGHNAIIRVAPFTAHCGLPTLRGEEPFGGEILSHDFVEAALLRRAGWEVWLAPDLGESYEELPPTLIDYAKRDRRWCQGNLQHLPLIAARNFPVLSRFHFLTGILSYSASPLWLLFLLVSGLQAFIAEQSEPVYFFGDNLFPVWPTSYAVEMTTVLAVTLMILFLPKVLALIWLFKQRQMSLAHYGGAFNVTVSVLLETLLSVLLAPILMLFQSKFVAAILLRRSIGWPAQRRGDHATGFVEALIAHGDHMVLGIGAGVIAYYYIPTFFIWLIPVIIGPALAIPLSMLTSRVTWGRQARQWGLFVIPEEVQPPLLLQQFERALAHEKTIGNATEGFEAAVNDPYMNALHIALLPDTSPLGKRHRLYLESVLLKGVEEGWMRLSATEKKELLSYPWSVTQLHQQGWMAPGMG